MFLVAFFFFFFLQNFYSSPLNPLLATLPTLWKTRLSGCIATARAKKHSHLQTRNNPLYVQNSSSTTSYFITWPCSNCCPIEQSKFEK